MDRSPEPTQQDQQDQADYYHLLAQNVQDIGMFITNLEGRITAWNPGAEHILGWTEQEALGQPCAMIFTPEDRAVGVPEAELTTALAEGNAPDERWHQRKDGSRFFAEGTLTALKDGHVRGFGKVLRDVTARKRSEQELLAAHQRERCIAQALQRPLTLRPEPDGFPGLTLATHYEPASDEADAGGDFFDVFGLPRGRVCLAVADASGKGLQAAARAIQVREVLRAFAREYPHSPAHIAARINDYVHDNQHLAPEAAPGEQFVTLALVILDPYTGEASVVSAAAEPPLLLRAAGGVEVIESPHGLGGTPLGVQGAEMYHATPLRLGHGDTLLLTTDGITEARRSRKQFLGMEGLAEIAVRASQPSAALHEAATSIVEEARQFGKGRFRDDVCLLMARRK